MSTEIPNDRACALLECLCLLKIYRAWNNEQIALCLSYSFPGMRIGAENVENLFRETSRHRHEWMQVMRQDVQDEEESELKDWMTDILEGHEAGRKILSKTEKISQKDARQIFPLSKLQSRLFPERYPQGFNVVDYLMSVIRGYPYTLSPDHTV